MPLFQFQFSLYLLILLYSVKDKFLFDDTIEYTFLALK